MGTGRQGMGGLYLALRAVQPCPFLARLAACLPWMLRPRMDPCPTRFFPGAVRGPAPHTLTRRRGIRSRSIIDTAIR